MTCRPQCIFRTGRLKNGCIAVFSALLFSSCLAGCSTTGNVTRPTSTPSSSSSEKTGIFPEGGSSRLISLSTEKTGELLESHNSARRSVNVSPLVWSDDLAEYAQEWALYLAGHGCQMHHRSELGQKKRRLGENIYWKGPLIIIESRSGKEIERQLENTPPVKVVGKWLDEQHDYSLSSNQCASGKECGHYTQVMWHSTKKVGCAAASCPDDGQIWVCNYDPPGNVIWTLTDGSTESERPY